MRGLFLIFFIAVNFIYGSQSCYEIYELEDKNELNSSIFILIDETAKFDKVVKKQLIYNVENLVTSNTYFYIAKFSAFIDGFYNQKVYDIKIEEKMNKDDEYYEPKNKLAKFNKCLKDQKPYAKVQIKSVLEELISHDEIQIAKSEILNALKDYSAVIRKNKAKNKLVIILSDMLENSDTTSFYAKKSLRRLDENLEFKKVVSNELLGDFGRAKIYVLGAGMIDNNSYKNSAILKNFKSFWMKYFDASNASLAEFAMPTLKSEIEF